MKVAVIGASGFLGRHILNCLGDMDVEVVAADRNTGPLLERTDHCHIVELDLNESGEVSPLDRLGRPDTVIHLAWGGLTDYGSSQHLDSELPMQKGFLESLLADGLKNLTVTGTCFEYGMQEGKLSEVMPALPNNPYGKAKNELRKYLECLLDEYNFNLVWCRLFYMFGEGQSEKSIYSMLRTAAARGDTSFPMSAGQQERDYLPVESVARCIVDLAMSCQAIGLVNVCSGKGTKLCDLVQGWIFENGWDIEMKLGVFPYSKYEPMSFWGDDTKLRQVLSEDVVSEIQA